MSIVLILVLAYGGILLWLRWSEPRMLYYPIRQLDQTPDKLGFKYEDVTLTTADGVRINGWFLPSANTERSSPLTVLFFHGNAGNISHRFEKFEVFRDLGVATFIIDYRGYGRSEGKPSEAGTYLDAQAAYEYLTGGAPGGRALPGRSIVAYGESLGAAVAADLASKVEVGGLVLEEGFTSVGDVGQKMYPFLPVRRLVRNKYDTLSKMAAIHVPLLILHSRDDEFFDIGHAQRILAAANEPKQLVELQGGHNDAFLISALTYRTALHKFFGSVAAAPATK